MSNTLTDEHKDELKGYFEKWQKKLSLGDWRIVHSTKAAARGAMADVRLTYRARLATWRVGDFGGCTVDSKSLEEVAIHESLHILLHELTVMVKNEAAPELIEACEHRIINTLEPILMNVRD